MKNSSKIIFALLASFAFTIPAHAGSFSESEYLNALDAAIEAVGKDIEKPETPDHIILSPREVDDLKDVKSLLSKIKAKYNKSKDKSVVKFFSKENYTGPNYMSLFPLVSCNSGCYTPPPETSLSYIALKKLFNLDRQLKAMMR